MSLFVVVYLSGVVAVACEREVCHAFTCDAPEGLWPRLILPFVWPLSSLLLFVALVVSAIEWAANLVRW